MLYISCRKLKEYSPNMENDAYASTSDDREERIKARRLRIDARNASRNDEVNGKLRELPEKQELSLGKKQVKASLESIGNLKHKTVGHVTEIRLEAVGGKTRGGCKRRNS